MTERSKHTPGPWRWGWSAEIGDFERGVTILAPGRGEVARVSNMERGKEYSDNETHDETRANANLVVAIPEMYALIERVSNIRGCDVRDAEWVKDQAVALLAKLVADGTDIAT